MIGPELHTLTGGAMAGGAEAAGLAILLFVLAVVRQMLAEETTA